MLTRKERKRKRATKLQVSHEGKRGLGGRGELLEGLSVPLSPISRAEHGSSHVTCRGDDVRIKDLVRGGSLKVGDILCIRHQSQADGITVEKECIVRQKPVISV